jgi:predicted kinase
MTLLVALHGLAGSGKSTLARALSRILHWPLIDKDDIRDALPDDLPQVGMLAYTIFWNIVRRQVRQGLSVIADSPLSFAISHAAATAIAQEAGATLAVIRCFCSDESEWARRIEARKKLDLPAHHQTDWQRFQSVRATFQDFTLAAPVLAVDTTCALDEITAQACAWLGNLAAQTAGD